MVREWEAESVLPESTEVVALQLEEPHHVPRVENEGVSVENKAAQLSLHRIRGNLRLDLVPPTCQPLAFVMSHCVIDIMDQSVLIESRPEHIMAMCTNFYEVSQPIQRNNRNEVMLV